jgi:hypothetical protein
VRGIFAPDEGDAAGRDKVANQLCVLIKVLRSQNPGAGLQVLVCGLEIDAVRDFMSSGRDD